jgi:hypothetical protein
MRIAAAASQVRGDSPTKQLGFMVYAIGMASNFICSAYCHHVPHPLPPPPPARPLGCCAAQRAPAPRVGGSRARLCASILSSGPDPQVRPRRRHAALVAVGTDAATRHHGSRGHRLACRGCLHGGHAAVQVLRHSLSRLGSRSGLHGPHLRVLPSTLSLSKLMSQFTCGRASSHHLRYLDGGPWRGGSHYGNPGVDYPQHPISS